jgi:glycosyltransferase involved in cell wall biosynthesis
VPPLVSVVTPFFDTAGYLGECIDSVLAQTCGDFEYLLVDNASTDGSRRIAEERARRDRRLRVVAEREHLPQIANYNRALRHVDPASAYCKIVQADDRIAPDCLRAMIAAARSGERVALVGSQSHYEGELSHLGLPDGRSVFPGREVLRGYLARDLYVLGSPTCLLNRTCDVRGRQPFYAEHGPCEDTRAAFDLLLEADFGFVHRPLTFNRRQPGSAWSRLSCYNALLAQQLALAHVYGPRLFAPDELGAVLRRLRARYYRYLGRSVLGGRPREFWRYHRETLAWAGQRIEPLRLLRGIAAELAGTAAHPVPAARVARAKWRRRAAVR